MLIDDVTQIWNGFDHLKGVRGHVQVGCTLPLDGSQDHLIYHDLKPFWGELQMDDIRKDTRCPTYVGSYVRMHV